MSGNNIISQIQKFWQLLSTGSGFGRVLDKVNIVEAKDGCGLAEFTVCEEHTNSGGILHGGFTATVVDVVSGIGLLTHDRKPPIGVSLNLNISFLNPAKIGDVVLIESKTEKSGKNIAFLKIVVKNKTTGKIIATASHTKYLEDKFLSFIKLT